MWNQQGGLTIQVDCTDGISKVDWLSRVIIWYQQGRLAVKSGLYGINKVDGPTKWHIRYQKRILAVPSGLYDSEQYNINKLSQVDSLVSTRWTGCPKWIIRKVDWLFQVDYMISTRWIDYPKWNIGYQQDRLLSLFSFSLGDDTKWPTMADLSLKPKHNQSIVMWSLYCGKLGLCHLYKVIYVWWVCFILLRIHIARVSTCLH